MMTGTNRKPPTALRDWAFAELALRPEMSNSEGRGTLLRRLSDMDFMPPSAWHSALRVAAIAPADGAISQPVVAARHAIEKALRTEVEALQTFTRGWSDNRGWIIMAVCVVITLMRLSTNEYNHYSTPTRSSQPWPDEIK